jgi:hypothetical protein
MQTVTTYRQFYGPIGTSCPSEDGVGISFFYPMGYPPIYKFQRRANAFLPDNASFYML